ncbi:MAG: WbqC family protein [Oligoflexia bacterium]|nr:WbqC family protein [Oligoflexia bacterium]
MENLSKTKKIIAIQQPEHFPWIGFFDKMTKSCQYVLLDNVQFKKRYFENRNKIRTTSGSDWICIPVKSKGKFEQLIQEVQVDHSQLWQSKYLNKIYYNYKKTINFEKYFEKIEKIINEKKELLVEYNLELINFVKFILGIGTKLTLASEVVAYDEKIRGSDLILQIADKLHATIYFSGPAGRDYLKGDTFLAANIAIEYHNYTHPTYPQLHQPFISHLSSLDYVMNMESANI